jgi:stress response protein YsnF
MKKLGLFIGIFFIFVVGANAQAKNPVANCVVPTGFVCITQEAANNAASAIKQNVALLEEITGLKAEIETHRQNELQLIKSAQDNDAKASAQMQKDEAEIARLTGELTSKDAELTRNTAIIDVLLKSVRKKCMPFSLCIN